ncbi:uncharacterized protein LOC142177429 [Nicotiana tabacum]|uniref:Uncharacterized protein LOC142177429 n=1 Tax=Nicotiana tabacum TaxID=4097 RepID=A0AC58TY04_TOBAC
MAYKFATAHTGAKKAEARVNDIFAVRQTMGKGLRMERFRKTKRKLKNSGCRQPVTACCDNGPQFVGKRATEFFEKWRIKRILSTPYHPSANGQAESSNKVILNILKKKLEEAKGLLPERLPEVLWAYRTMPKTSTGEMPYSLVYGTDAVIPIEVGDPSLRYSNESGTGNDESRLQDLDEVEERRDMDHIRMVTQKQQVEIYYNKRAKVQPLKVGDYVIKAKTQTSKDPNKGKLRTNWDGPYKIVAAASKVAFQLETIEGKLLQNNWNVAHLKHFHF